MFGQKAHPINPVCMVLSSLGIGCLLTMTFLTAGIMTLRSKVTQRLFETLLWPGFAVAQWYYGGLHGGEPIFLAIVVNTCVYGAACFLVLWLRSDRQSDR